MPRLTDNDSSWGPFTWGKTSGWRPLRVVWSSGAGEDGNEPNNLTIYALGRVARIVLPNILPNWRHGWKVAPREYGFSWCNGFFQLFYGPQTNSSDTTKSWSCFVPWQNWRFTACRYYNLDGTLFKEFKYSRNTLHDWDAERNFVERVPKAVFTVLDTDLEKINVATYIEEREWKLGERWCSWLSWFAPAKTVRSLNIQFDKEVGPDKGSWKGGLMSTSEVMEVGQTPLEAFINFCSKKHHSKSGTFELMLLI
jgi:hypothetical protein